jgi:adenosylcobinamide-GDP ribazoletransferase
MLWLPPARSDGLGAGAGRPVPDAVYIGITIASLAVWLVLGLGALILGAILGGGAAWLVGILAKRRIGGQTGDVLGAAVLACEIGVLLATVIVLT